MELIKTNMEFVLSISTPISSNAQPRLSPSHRLRLKYNLHNTIAETMTIKEHLFHTSDI